MPGSETVQQKLRERQRGWGKVAPGRFQWLSQGLQDAYLQVVFDCIGTTNKFFVEFGFSESDQGIR